MGHHDLWAGPAAQEAEAQAEGEAVRRKYSPEKRAQLFWGRVDKSAGPDACWPWTGSRDRHGYGRLRGDSKIIYASRYVMELMGRQVPSGMMVCHHCDNPPCCNPKHLYVGTAQDNSDDRVARMRGPRALPELKLTSEEEEQLLSMFGPRAGVTRAP